MHFKYDYIFKLLLIGDSGVGKSCLFSLFVDKSYAEICKCACGADFTIRTINLDGKKIKLQIWDTSNQKRLRQIPTTFYRDARGIIVIYDVTNEKSFNNVKQCLEEVDRNANENVNKILVGNKSDLTTEKVVKYNEAKKYAESLNIPFLEVSAKDGSNVEDILMTIVMEIKSRIPDQPANNVSVNTQRKWAQTLRSFFWKF